MSTPTPVVNDEHAPVEREVERDDRCARGDQIDQRAAAPEREQDAGRGAEQRQQQALDQQLARDEPARRAERQPDAQLALPRGGLREQEIGHVRARDEQHHRDDAEQHEQRLAVALAQTGDAGVAGRQLERPRDVVLLVLRPPVLRNRRLTQCRMEGREPRLRLFHRLSGREAREEPQPPGAAAVERALGAADDRFGAERNGHVERAADFEAVELRRRRRRRW